MRGSGDGGDLTTADSDAREPDAAPTKATMAAIILSRWWHGNLRGGRTGKTGKKISIKTWRERQNIAKPPGNAGNTPPRPTERSVVALNLFVR